jgi:hypothetical protein
MLGLGKFLLLGLILLALWQGVKVFTRVGAFRQAVRRAAEQAAAQGQPRNAQAIPAEDLVKCPVCGAFVPAKSATSCGRGDCPWGR